MPQFDPGTRGHSRAKLCGSFGVCGIPKGELREVGNRQPLNRLQTGSCPERTGRNGPQGYALRYRRKEGISGRKASEVTTGDAALFQILLVVFLGAPEL